MSRREEAREAEEAKQVFELVEVLKAADELELQDVVIDAEELTLELIPPTAPSAPSYIRLILEPAAPIPGAPEGGRLELLVEATPEGLRLLGLPLAPPAERAVPAPPFLKVPKVAELLKLEYKYPDPGFTYEVAEVQIGATKAEGGSRGKVIKVGGVKSLYCFRFLEIPKNRPVISLDVFDHPPPLPGHVKAYYSDVLVDPCSWASKAISVFGADMVSVHLISTDPGGLNRSAQEAARTIEDVLQCIEEPMVVGGSGNPEKDLEVFEKVAEATSGERLVLASVTLDMDVAKYCEVVKRTGHVALALAFMDINQVRDLARKVLDYGVPRDRLIIDPSTGGLGYGIEYTFSIMERMKLMALKGADELREPISCAATNAWAAREAWLKNVPEWGPREWRGPLWEAVTALVLMLAGADFFMMLHPLAAKIVKTMAEAMCSPKASEAFRTAEDYYTWVTTAY